MTDSSLHFVLSPPEAVESFRRIAETALELHGGLTPDVRALLDRKAAELGVHSADREAAIDEALKLPEVVAAAARATAGPVPAPAYAPAGTLNSVPTPQGQVEPRILAVCFHPDGRLFVLGSHGLLWPRPHIFEPLAGGNGATCGDLSPETGRFALEAGTEILVYQGDRSLLRIPVGHSVSAIAFGPKGALLATRSEGAAPTYRIWDPASGEERTSDVGVHGGTTGPDVADWFRDPRSRIGAVARSPDGRFVACGMEIRTLGPAAGASFVVEHPGWERNRGTLCRIAIGSRLFAAVRGTSIAVWDHTLGVRPFFDLPEVGRVGGIALSPDESRLAVFLHDSTEVVEFDLASRISVLRVAGHEALRGGLPNEIVDIDVEPHANLIATVATDDRILVRNAGTFEVVRRFPDKPSRHSGGVGVAFAAGGREVIGTSELQLWDLETGKRWCRCLCVGATQVAFNGHRLAVVGKRQDARGEFVVDRNVIKVFDLDAKTGLFQLLVKDRMPVAELPVPQGVTALAFAPDGSLVHGGPDGRLRFRKSNGWSEVGTLPAFEADPDRAVVAIAFGGILRWMAAGTKQGNIGIWRPGPSGGQSSDAFVAGPSFPHGFSSLSRLAVSPDGDLVAGLGWARTGLSGRVIRVWEVSTGRLDCWLEGRRPDGTDVIGGDNALAFTTDSRSLLFGAPNGELGVWTLPVDHRIHLEA